MDNAFTSRTSIVSGDVGSPAFGTPGGGPVSLTFSGLLAHYTFDNTAWLDSSGNSNNLTATGSPTLVPGQINSAVQLSGGPDYFNFANAGAFTLSTKTSPLSISCWIKTTATDGMVVSLRGPANSGNPLLEFGVGNNNINMTSGLFATLFRDDGGAGLLSLVGPTVNDGKEHFVVWTRDTSQNQVLYVDNVNVASGTDTASSSTTFTNADSAVGLEQYWFTNGGSPAGKPVGEPWVGSIDDLQFYGRALSPSEVSQIYNAGI